MNYEYEIRVIVYEMKGNVIKFVKVGFIIIDCNKWWWYEIIKKDNLLKRV